MITMFDRVAYMFEYNRKYKAAHKKDRVPPPHKRLCKIHSRPIQPSKWRQGNRTTKCTLCVNMYNRSPKNEARREKRWQENFIPCIKHPDRRCNRSVFVHNARRACGSCITRTPDGQKRECVRRANSKYKKSVHGKEQCNWKRRSLYLYHKIQENKI